MGPGPHLRLLADSGDVHDLLRRRLRYLSLIGGACGSFYDWYCDLPAASPQTWGEQTDVPEAADWYNSTYLIITGANLPMTQHPDAHFMTEVRYKGTRSSPWPRTMREIREIRRTSGCRSSRAPTPRPSWPWATWR